MNQLPLFLKQIPVFGFLFVGIFVLLLIFFKYRTRGSLTIYYISFVMLGLGLGEFYLSAHAFEPSNSNFENADANGNHMIADNDLGYQLAPGPRQAHFIKRSSKGEPIYNVTYTINALGLRGANQSGSTPTVFFFGDSFTFGEGVSDVETLPARFAQTSGYSVFNFGVHGYGAQQFLRALEVSRPERMGIRKEHALVVFSLLNTHVDRAAGRAPWDTDGPLYENLPGGLTLSGSFRSLHGMPGRILNKSNIYKQIRTMFSEAGDRQRLLAIIEAANKLVKQRYGTDMIVIFWDSFPRTPPQHETVRAAWLRENLTKSGIANLPVSEMVPPLQGSEYYIAGDGHPNATAYLAAAAALFKYCNDKALFKEH
jgi:hypothetical protein